MKNRVTILIISVFGLGLIFGFLVGIVVEITRGRSLVEEVNECRSLGGELSVWHNDQASRYEAECIVAEESKIIFEYWIND